MAGPFYDTSGGGAGKDLFDNTGRAGQAPPGGGGSGPTATSPGVGGWTGNGVGTAPGGGLDLSDTRRIITQTGTGQTYGQANSEALGQYAGGANDLAAHYSQQGAAAQGRAGEQITNPYAYQDRNNNDYAQGQQRAALGTLADAANGYAPSQASIQMQQGLQQSLAGQMAAANSTRGGGAAMALAQRNAAAQGSAMQGNVMGQQAALRANEMAQARSAYMQGSNDLRGANQGAYGMDQQSAFQQAGLNATQRAQNDQYQQGYEGMGLDALKAQQASDTSKYGADRNVAISNSQQASSNTAAAAGMTAAGVAALGTALSDMNLKTDVSTSSPSMGGIIRDNPYGMDSGGSTSGGIIRDNPYDSMLGAKPGPSPFAGLGQAGVNLAFKSDERLKSDISTDGLSARTKQPSVLPGELASMARTGSRGQVTQFASDEGLKTDMSGNRAASEADAFLASLHPSSYRYKDASNEPGLGSGGGRYLGIMAQDVEKGPTGNTIVRDTPAGKAIDVKPMVSGLAAGVGRLHERLSELEMAKKGKK